MNLWTGQEAQTEQLAVPKVGDDIYIPTALYLSHGRDDFSGGLCRVMEVVAAVSAGKPTPFVVVAERPGHQYNWRILAERQEELRQQYGDRRGQADPDDREEFNRDD